MSPVSRKRKKKNEKRGPTPKRQVVLDFPVDFGPPQPTGVTLPPPSREPGAIRLKITLLGSDPLIWRRVEVPARTTLESLHWVLQTAFAWETCHPHVFEVDAGAVRNETSAGLPAPGSKLYYVYDFGDDWTHEIEVEELSTERDIDTVTCLDGASAAPEEDCGGVWGWTQLCGILANPSHPQHAERLEWLGYVPDPHAFDIDDVNRGLAELTIR